MKTKKLIYFFCCCLPAWGASDVFAQQGFVATGGNATGTGGSVSYSIGQVDYVSASNSNYNLNQGLQQPFEISIVGTEEETANPAASVFPNPSGGDVTLKVENGNSGKLSYQLFDAQGKLLLQEKIQADETSVSMSRLAVSKYFLKVTDSNNQIITFKIVKLY